MISKNFLQRLLKSAFTRPAERGSRSRYRKQMCTEQLETRTLLTTFTVSTSADGGPGSLRQAVISANGSVGADEIVFAPSTNGTEFNLTSGQMAITESVTITGNGSNSTIMDAQQTSRIFDITAGDVTLERLTLKNGRTTGANQFGGAIRATSSGTLTIAESTFQANSTTGTGSEGGAIRSQNGVIRITDSTFQGNSTAGANAGGGAIFSRNGGVQLVRSTISGNSTAGNNSAGGAIFTYSTPANITMVQSTISGNSTAGTSSSGGAVFSVFGNVTVVQSTLTSNTATQSAGGAIFSYSSPLNISNTIVAGNTDNGTAPDIRKSPSDALTVTASLIGRNNDTGLTATVGTTPDINGNLIGGATDGTKINPLLGSLSNNGGPTQTHALLSGSPAIDRGDNSLSVDVTNSNTPLPHDQRGNPFGRFSGLSVDIGSYERQTVAGLSLIVDTNQDENDGNYAAGDLSLREAVGLANGSLGSDTITFATSTNGAEFDLTLGEMFETDTLTITGNGATSTIVDAQQLSRIFNSQFGDFTLSSVSLKDGKTTASGNGGGAIASSSSGVLTIQNSTLSNNSTTGNVSRGGAVYSNFGAVTISQSTLSGNQARGTNSDGGGLWFDNSVVTIVNSTITGNSSARAGGGLGMLVDATDKKLMIHNSIIAGNTAASNPDFTAPTTPATNLEVRSSLIGRSNGTTLTATGGTTPGANGNLIGGASDALKINPQFGPLSNNGGPTQTHALLTSSPALNRGDNTRAVDVTQPGNPTLIVDQRGSGFARTQFGIVDMGSIEMVGVSISSASVLENEGVLAFTIAISKPSPVGQTITVRFDATAFLVGQNLATAGTDFTAVSNRTITFVGGGPFVQQTTVAINNDTLFEASETFGVSLSSAIIATASAIGTILNDDSAPTVTLAVNNATIAEAAGVATFTATLSAISGQAVTIALGYSGTATLTSDYTRSNTQIVIPAGQLTGTVTVNAVQDALDELNEPVIVDITSVTNGTESGVQQKTTTITDDDATPTVILSRNFRTINEAAGIATFTAVLSARSSLPITVSLGFSGTATLTSDYTLNATQIVIPAGQLSASITVTAKQDAIDESNETVIVDINSVTNGTESGVQQLSTLILDDDAAPTVTLAVNNATIADSLTGGTGIDWYFRALDDVIIDFFAGETIDVL